jgi:DNA invertase Pin-like site-specific DNA recombinase
MSPFRRQNPEGPGALAAHAGIRAGGGWQQPLLPRPPPGWPGRGPVIGELRPRVRELKAGGMRPTDIAKALEIGRASVYRVLGQKAARRSAT